MSLVKTYNYSSLITSEEINIAIGQIDEIIANGNYFKNSPKFQTQQNLFAIQDPVWLKLRMTFLTSVFMYLGQERQVGNMMAWCFKTNNSTQEDRNNYWHHHNKHSGNSISGIMYLRIPDDVTDISTCGTEMAPHGPEGDGKFYTLPTELCWNIYPSETWHRPGPTQSDNWRYVLAADIDYV